MTRNTRNWLVLVLAVVAGSITQEVIGRYWTARKLQSLAESDVAPWTAASSLAGAAATPSTLLATAQPVPPPTEALAADQVAPDADDALPPSAEPAMEAISVADAVPPQDALALAEPYASSDVPAGEPSESASDNPPADGGLGMLQLVESDAVPGESSAPPVAEPNGPTGPADLVQTPPAPEVAEPAQPADLAELAAPPPQAEVIPAVPAPEQIAQPQTGGPIPPPAPAAEPVTPPVFDAPPARSRVETVPGALAATPLVAPPSADQYPILPTPTSADAASSMPRLDPQTLVRQRAVAKAEQRRLRIEARNWLGYLPTRPPVPSTPFTSGDSLRPIVVVVPQIMVETR
jgi:hypothetical protein